MTRLEELRQQKREIEAEIKKLSQKEIRVGRCKFHCQHYSTVRKDEWIVTYESRSHNKQEERNKRLIANTNRDEAIKQISDVITDLQKLQETLLNTPYGE